MRVRRWIINGATAVSTAIFLLSLLLLWDLNATTGVDFAGATVTNAFTGETTFISRQRYITIAARASRGCVLLAVTSAVLPLAWVARKVNRLRTKSVQRYRRLSGLCPACGYDARETVDKCPECGASKDLYEAIRT
jgi:hypothetical protein